MEFRDLGSLQVEVDGIAVPLSGRRLESVLALLVANAGEVVTVDALVDAVWGEVASDRAPQSLESLVWRLRKVLEPDRVARQAATVLQTDDRGYRLVVSAESVDSHRLVEASRTVPELVAAGEAVRALDAADAVLALWRGPPYLGVLDADWMPPVRGRLEEAHLAVAQHRVEALLRTAQPERALDALGPLLAAHPHREQLWGQRMLAFYRCGRQADALAAYGEARAVLSDELGVEPGPELRAIHQRILTQDTSLDLAAPPRADQTVRLPGRRGALVGRADELKRLTALVRDRPLVTLTGPGGSGKTRLAVEAAHLGRGDHPDGVWFVDLADIDDTTAVWPRIAVTIGLAPQVGATVAAVVLAFLAHRTVLLVLDNCEQVADGVRAAADRILDACPGVAVLATSREPLDLPDEHVFAVPPLPVPNAPDDLAANPAATLFLQRVGRAPGGLDGPDRAAVVRICAAVDGLPLGLELAAAHARAFELSEVAAALERDPIGLTRPGGGPARQLTLYDTVDWSYRLARPAEQVLHRRLATVNGPVTLDAASTLCSVAPLRSAQAMDLLTGLVHRSMLTHVRPDRSGGPSRFSQAVPIRAHARVSLTEAGDAAAVEHARDRWVLDRVIDAPGDGRDGQAAWYDWLEANHAALTTTLTATLVDRPSAAGLRIAEALVNYWYDRNLMIASMRWLAAAHRLPGLDPVDRACVDAVYGAALALNFDRDAARAKFGNAIAVLASADDPHARRSGNLLVVVCASAWAADLWGESAAAARSAIAIAERIDEPHISLRARAVLSACTLIAGDTEGALGAAEGVLTDNRAVGNHFAAFFACVTNGIAALFARNPESGLHWNGQAMHHQRALGIRNVGDSLEQRGAHFTIAGNHVAALRCYGASAALSEREGRPWPHHPGTPQRLDSLASALSARDYARNWASGQRRGHDTHDQLPDEWT